MSDMHPEIAELIGLTAAPIPAAVTAPPRDSASAGQPGGVSYDGSSVTENLALWQPQLRSADADLLPEKYALDARSRDMARNDAYVAGGAAVHKDNIVGAYYRLNARPQTKVLWGKEDEKWEAEFQEEVESKFTLWAESPSCWSDAARVNTLTEQVRLAIGVYTIGGEVLASAEWSPNDGRPFRTCVQMIDADRLSTPYDLVNLTEIRSGVERDRRGAPLAYHIRTTHPNDFDYRLTFLDAFKWKRVPARKPWGRQMILHVFEQMRPDQTRGVASMASALSEMRMMRAFRKVELERAVVAATYAASIESDMPAGDVYTGMGAGGENPAVAWMEDYLEAIGQYTSNAKNIHMNGAKIPVFAPGTHLKIQNPGAASPVGASFEQSLLRHIAASLGVGYEQLSKDYSQANYSSTRASMSETWRSMQARKKMVADKYANFVYRLWMEEIVNANGLESLKRRNVPNFYDGLNGEAYTACDWIGAGQGLIEPLKETQADILALKAGLTTKDTVIARRTGADWRAVSKQIARELANDKNLDLPSVYEQDTQDMENSLTASPQEANP